MLATVGCVPCNSIKQRKQIVSEIRKWFKKVKIDIQEDFIFYESMDYKRKDRGSEI